MQLHRERDRIHALGAELHLVGNGAPHFAKAFREDLALEVPIYTDPSLATYRALGFRRSVRKSILSPASALHAVRALRGGFRQQGLQGDAWQLGGVVVVREDGRVLYRHAASENGDHPPVEVILAALGGRGSAAAGR